MIAEDTHYMVIINYYMYEYKILIGESGSGKTSASKYLMQYIATLTPHAETRVRNQLIVTNPLLEAFGNARTTRNNNASRFVSRNVMNVSIILRMFRNQHVLSLAVLNNVIEIYR